MRSEGSEWPMLRGDRISTRSRRPEPQPASAGQVSGRYSCLRHRGSRMRCAVRAAEFPRSADPRMAQRDPDSAVPGPRVPGPGTALRSGDGVAHPYPPWGHPSLRRRRPKVTMRPPASIARRAAPTRLPTLLAPVSASSSSSAATTSSSSTTSSISATTATG